MKDGKVGRGGLELGSKFPIVLLHACKIRNYLVYLCDGTITDKDLRYIEKSLCPLIVTATNRIRLVYARVQFRYFQIKNFGHKKRKEGSNIKLEIRAQHEIEIMKS